MDAKKHYDAHLAAFYSWMIGDFDTAQRLVTDYFKKHKVRPRYNGFAIDLGAGTGIQSVALAQLGFRVQAVDFSAYLLSELRERAWNLPVEVYEGDLLDFRQYLKGESPELIVCMGDTLTHLNSIEEVAALLVNCYQAILPGGFLILSFRPLVQKLKDTQRFLPVRSDANRIHTCFLEYFSDKVRVTDLLHERENNGVWSQKASSYYKLRLALEDVIKLLKQASWQITGQEIRQGMIYLIAVRLS